MTDTAPLAAEATEDARGPVPTPEADRPATPKPEEQKISPLEQPVNLSAATAAHTSIADAKKEVANDNETDTKPHLKTAEKQLADFLKDNLPPSLSRDLKLTLRDAKNNGLTPLTIADSDAMDIQMEFKGPHVNAKADELMEALDAALKKYPPFRDQYIPSSHLTAGPDNDPHPEQTGAKMNCMYFMISALPLTQYREFVAANDHPAPTVTEATHHAAVAEKPAMAASHAK